MKAAFCPICDQKMQGKHFCSNCKSFIWKPVMMEDYTKRYKTSLESEKTARKVTTFPANYKKRRPFVAIILIIFFILSSFISFISNQEFDDWSAGGAENYNHIEDYSNRGYTEEEITLSKDTVIKDYDECDGLQHIDIKADEFIRILDAYMDKTLPLTDIDEYDDIKLVRKIFEDGKTEDKTYFHSYIDTYYSDDIDLGYYIDYDTSSYRLHMFDAGSNDKELLIEIIQLFIDTTGEELLDSDESLHDFFVFNSGDDYTSLYRDNYWLYFSVYENEEEFRYYFSVELY